MKLQDIVIMGRFMGLDTVNECFLNYEMHYLQMLPYPEAGIDHHNSILEYNNYLKDKLELDWEYIDRQVEKQNKEFEEYCEKNPPQELDFNVEA